jgi:hypothetical protein
MTIHSKRLQNSRLPLLTCLVLSLLLSFSALAQTAAPPPLPTEAEAAMKKGILAAKEQEWLIAIQSFQEARKTAPESPALFATVFSSLILKPSTCGRPILRGKTCEQF